MILLCPLSKEWFAPFVELFNGSFSVFQMIHFFCRWSWFQLQLSVMKMHRFNSQYIVNSWIGAGSIECNRRGSPLKNRPSNAGEIEIWYMHAGMESKKCSQSLDIGFLSWVGRSSCLVRLLWMVDKEGSVFCHGKMSLERLTDTRYSLVV